MLAASLAAWVPVFIAMPTSAWARAGASLVPSPVIATRRPRCCCSRISSILRSGVASARKSSTPGLARDRGGGARVVARDHHGADAHRPEAREPLGDAELHHVLQVDDAEDLARRRRPRAACRRSRRCAPTPTSRSAGTAPPCARTHCTTASTAPLRYSWPSRLQPLMRVWALKGTNFARPASSAASAARVALPHQLHDRAPLGRLVGGARQVGRRRQRVGRRRPPTGSSSVASRLPIVIVPVLSRSSTSTSPAASIARPDIASTFFWISRSMPGDADRREQPADRGRDQAHEQGRSPPAPRARPRRRARAGRA